MQAAQDSNSFDVSSFLRYDELSQECKELISSLLSDKDFMGNNLCNYHGCWYVYNFLQRILNVQKHFQSEDTDIILSSFPKSGTTWFKALVFALVERRKYRANPENHPLLKDNSHDLVPFLDLRLYFNNKIPDLTRFAPPRLFATHMPLLELQEAVKDSNCKIVYVCRNPKDIMVSDWHFYSAVLNRECASLEAIVDSFCRGVYNYGPFWDHVLRYWEESLENPNRVLFMRYEDMKEKPRAELKRLADFLGYPFTAEEEESGSVDEIVNLCSLQNLSNQDINKSGKSPFNVDFKSFFRKGEVGDWKNHMTPEMGRRIDGIIETKLQGSGLKFE